LASGTGILLATIITAALLGVGPRRYVGAVYATWVQSRMAILTVMLIVGLAYLWKLFRHELHAGLGVASAGLFFRCCPRFLGWVAVFLSGSDTSGNAPLRQPASLSQPTSSGSTRC